MKNNYEGRVHVIVVMAPEVVPHKTRPFPKFDAAGNYIDGLSRMKAIKRYHKAHPNAIIVLVGGIGLDSEGELFAKASIMEQYVRKMCSHADIRIVHTLPSSRYNFIGLFQEVPELLREGRVALLSNRYHQERALRLWHEVAQSFCLPPRPAMFWGAEISVSLNPANGKYKREIDRRLRMEKKGIADLKSGTYRDIFWSNEPLLAALRTSPKFRHLLPTDNNMAA